MRQDSRTRQVWHAFGGGDIQKVITSEEMRQRAKARLPRAVYDGIEGGAGDELTIGANRSAFERVWLRPRACADVSRRDISTTVLGDKISMPVMLAPCGFSRMCDSEAELASVRAAGRAGTVFAVSGAASYSPDEIMKASSGPLWYQLYMRGDLAEADTLLKSVADSGYRVLCVTIDSAILPKRDRDYYNKLTVPLALSPQLLLAGLSRPAWSKDFVFGKVGRGSGFKKAKAAYWQFATTIMQLRSVTFDDIRWLREKWDGPLVIKGLMRGDEVPELIEIGVDGIVVSNHGGRNLDTVRGTLDILPEVVSAADGRAEIFIDGGVRRGVDVVKAVALGARACLIGRPYMYGLAAAGEAGVHRILEILRLELERTMGLAGCATIADVDRSIAMIEGVDPHINPPVTPARELTGAL